MRKKPHSSFDSLCERAHVSGVVLAMEKNGMVGGDDQKYVGWMGGSFRGEANATLENG